MKPGLSVHLMVKEPPVDRVAMLVEYLLTIANEFVIIDTGSTDETKDILRALPKVRLYEEDFIDFSVTRNKGLERHLYEWTLGIDPDELPSPVMMQHLAWVISDGQDEFPQAKAYLYWTKNYWGGVLGPERDYHWHARLWRTQSGRLYRPVHELLALDGKPEAQTRGTSIMPLAPRMAYLIHSKPASELARADELYARLGESEKTR